MRIINSNSITGIPVYNLKKFEQKTSTNECILDKCIFDYVYFKNESIYIQEDAANYLYLVISGFVKLSYLLEDGSCILLGIIPPGEGFGELGVFEGDFHTETATAMGDVCVARVRAKFFRNKIMQQAEAQHFLSQLLARRYRWYLNSTRNLSLSNLAARLSQVLLFLCDSLGRSTVIDGRRYPYLPTMITQSDLGAMARGTRGNVNRLLKKWEREGWILLQQRQITILKKNRLQAIVCEETC